MYLISLHIHFKPLIVYSLLHSFRLFARLFPDHFQYSD